MSAAPSVKPPPSPDDGPPQTYAELRKRLQDPLPSMSKGRGRIARLILTDPEGCAFRTISETAHAAEVHESTVVRFATALGLDGYPGLVELCRRHLTDQARLLRRFEQAEHQATAGGLLAAVGESDERNLARTYAQINSEDWERATALLTIAPSIHVIGLRKCYSVAYLLTYLLHLVRRSVHQLDPASGLLPDQLRDMSPGDVLVAISIHRYTADTVRALALAKARGVATIALTDNPASPLATQADISFYIETSGVTILRSLTAFASVVQAMATAVAVNSGRRSRSELLDDEELNRVFATFVDGVPDDRA
jgi:DNA-binding MurR/RpiR family transcriptional regulator